MTYLLTNGPLLAKLATFLLALLIVVPALLKKRRNDLDDKLP